MRPIDMLGIGPKREAIQDDTGWLVTVTPPEWSGFKASTLHLTEDQYIRYLDWTIRGVELIQDHLPDLSLAEQEILMSGIGDQEFAEFQDDLEALMILSPRDQGSQGEKPDDGSQDGGDWVNGDMKT